MSGEAPLLVVQKLEVAYGQAQVLFDVSLQLNRGETVALMGRNGAGKSTTLKALIGLLPPKEGTIVFCDQNIASMPTHHIARLGLGYVPEERRIFTDLTILENLEVGRRAARSGQQAWTPERLFEIFPNLAEMRHRRASQMSGGEQQMLTIARTLMGNPLAVMLDEPSEGLAPVIVEQMAIAVQKMKETGVSVLLSEQNLYFAEAVADRAYVIETGVVRYSGSMKELMQDEAVRSAYLAV